MLFEKLRNTLETLRHCTSPDDLYRSFINGVHIDWNSTLFLQFS